MLPHNLKETQDMVFAYHNVKLGLTLTFYITWCIDKNRNNVQSGL